MIDPAMLAFLFIALGVGVIGALVLRPEPPAKVPCPLCGDEQDAGRSECDRCGCPMGSA